MTSTVQRVIIGIAAMVLLGSLVVGLLLGAAVYGWKAALRAGNEAATLQDMKTVAAVEIQYYNTHNRKFWIVRAVDQGRHVNVQIFGRENEY